MRLRQSRRGRESTSDIDEPHRGRTGVIGVIQTPKFTEWACYAPRHDEGTEFWGIGEAVGPRRLSRKATVLVSTGRVDPPGEAPAASAAQARQGRAVHVCGFCGFCGVGSLVEVERPQAGNKMEAMEAVERVEGFFGGWSLHRSHMARAEMRIRVSIFFDPPKVRFQGGSARVQTQCEHDSHGRPPATAVQPPLRTTSRPRRGFAGCWLLDWLRVPSGPRLRHVYRYLVVGKTGAKGHAYIHSLIVAGRQRACAEWMEVGWMHRGRWD